MVEEGNLSEILDDSKIYAGFGKMYVIDTCIDSF